MERLVYKNDLKILKTRERIKTIFSYILLLFVWIGTVSIQTVYYHIMNTAVFIMLVLGVICMIYCREESENIIKTTKFQIFMYLIVIFIYDLFLKVLSNSLYNYAQQSVTGETGVIYLTTLSSILKVAYPIGFITWIIQKMYVYGHNKSKRATMEFERNIRKEKR